jgi:hypothetical protein
MNRIAGFLIAATLLFALTAAAEPPQEYSGNVGIFYSSLSRYGEWVNADAGFAWRPLRVGHHWRPYLHGRWAWTDYGWYWVSMEPFGWATFHYGRWIYDDYYGWIWIPDRVWGPAWVEWRYDDDYIGWAPLPPYAVYDINIGINWSTRWSAPIHYWSFLPCRRFTTARVADYVEPAERTRRIFGSTRGVVDIRTDRDRVINRGVEPRFIERRGNIRIGRADVIDRNEATQERFINDDRKTRIETYRPRIEDRTRTESAPVPTERRREGRRDDSRVPGRVEAPPPMNRDQQRAIEERRGSRDEQEAAEERRSNRDQERAIQERRADRDRERSVQESERRARQENRAPAVRQEERRERQQESPRISRDSQGSGRDRGATRGQPEQRGKGKRPF